MIGDVVNKSSVRWFAGYAQDTARTSTSPFDPMMGGPYEGHIAACHNACAMSVYFDTHAGAAVQGTSPGMRPPPGWTPAHDFVARQTAYCYSSRLMGSLLLINVVNCDRPTAKAAASRFPGPPRQRQKVPHLPHAAARP